MKRFISICLMLLVLQSIAFADSTNLGNKKYENDYYKVIISGTKIEVYNKVLNETTKITVLEESESSEWKTVYNVSIEFPNESFLRSGELHMVTQKEVEGLDDYLRMTYAIFEEKRYVGRIDKKLVFKTTVNIFDYKNVQAPYANVLWYDFFYEDHGGYNALDFTRQPEEINGDVVAPLIDMASKTGFQVNINEKTGKIECWNGVDKIFYEIGSPYMTIHGKLGDKVSIKTNVAVYMNNDTPMVSVRKYFETLGYWVSWDKKNRTMEIRGASRSYIDVAGISRFQYNRSEAKILKMDDLKIPKVNELEEIYPFRVRVGQLNTMGGLIDDYRFGVMKKDGSVVFDALASDIVNFYDNVGRVYYYDRENKISYGSLIDRKGNYILQGDDYNNIWMDKIGNITVGDRAGNTANFDKNGVRIPYTKYDSGHKFPNGIGQYLVSTGYNSPIFLTDVEGKIVSDNDLISYEEYTPDFKYSTVSTRMERSFNNALYGIADAYGKVLVPPIFEYENITHLYGSIFKIIHDEQVYYLDVAKKDMFDIKDELILKTDNINLYQTIHNSDYALKLTDKDGQQIAVNRAHYKDFYDKRYIVMHEYLGNLYQFEVNQTIPQDKRSMAFRWKAHFYEFGFYYPLIYDTQKDTFIPPPENAGAYVGNGYFEYRKLDENYFGLVHIDGHIVVPQSKVLETYKTKKFSNEDPDDTEYSVETMPYTQQLSK